MRRRGVLLVAWVCFALLALVSVSIASRHELDAMYSGGPSGEGRVCTDCHAFNEGSGRVELLGMPRRYRPGGTYDLTIRVADPDQAGAGFQISAENPGGHRGQFAVTDPLRTAYAGFGQSTTHVMHTETGVLDSMESWNELGGAYEYHLRWNAPATDVGPITFYVSGNAVNNSGDFFGDRYYSTHRTVRYAHPGDHDGDTDVDLPDVAAFQSCFDVDIESTTDACAMLDIIADQFISLDDHRAMSNYLAGPEAEYPAGYVLADPTRGGLLYDRWWLVVGAPEPTGHHPLYPPAGVQTGSVTYRCKECHGWDYKGVDGRYGAGSHFTGIPGVYGTQLTATEMFNLLLADSDTIPNGHGMGAYGLTELDAWDLVRMTLESVVDTDEYIAPDGSFHGNAFSGQIRFEASCAACHGFEGVDINFGTEAAPEYVGTVASENPWEFLHKARFGQPGSPMFGVELLYWSPAAQINLGTYAATLPP